MTQHKPFVYVAGPYADPNADVRFTRFKQHVNAAAFLIKRGHVVYSPITHCHPIANAGKINHGWSFWEHMDMPFLELSHLMVILPLDGWLESKGLWHEKEQAFYQQTPIAFLVDDKNTGQYQELTWSTDLVYQLKNMTPPYLNETPEKTEKVLCMKGSSTRF